MLTVMMAAVASLYRSKNTCSTFFLIDKDATRLKYVLFLVIKIGILKAAEHETYVMFFNLAFLGFPSPTITWSKLRSPLPWRHKVVNNSLVLPNVGRQDSGEYICTATNHMGTTEVTITLDVESECCGCQKSLLYISYFTM